MGIKDKINFLISKFNLEEHIEGGYFSQIYKSNDVVTIGEKTRKAATLIYFLLTGKTFSAWHRLTFDEAWHFCEGDPIKLHMIDQMGQLSHVVLGSVFLDQTYTYQAVIPKNTWFAAEVLLNTEGFGLCGCTVAPGFEYDDFELANRESLTTQYPSHEKIIKRFTR